jgi:RimJ/RimL family protein N-acetyltransferase
LAGSGGDTAARARVRLKPWRPDDLPLLRQGVGDPAMMVHLGGPESEAKIAERQARYEQPGSGQFKIIEEASGESVGWLGYWEREWGDEPAYEIGWFVSPAFQGKGIAAAAARKLLDRLRADGAVRFAYAYPSVDNAASNAITRKLGFELVDHAREFEYPKGSVMRCNVWRFELRGG